MPQPVKTAATQSQSGVLAPLNVAVLGAGGREHALAAKLSQSPLCRKVVVFPGNAGMERAGLAIAPIRFDDADEVLVQLKKFDIEFVVVGPDDLLAAGLVDVIEGAGIPAFGPSRAAARIESSKAFAKEIMTEAGVPTAKYTTLTDGDAKTLDHAAARVGGYPLVLKYDGLALGKGVRICEAKADAQAFLRDVFDVHKFERGASSKPTVVAEEFVRGREVSLFAVCDGERFVLLEPACDHKRLLDGDAGPNTGGMGAYSPVPWLKRERLNELATHVFAPVLSTMKKRGVPFRGLLYAGLMVADDAFWVLEFNARFGDPETQALMPRLKSDLLPLLYSSAKGDVSGALKVEWYASSAVNVVAASRGYPEKPETGFELEGLSPKGDTQIYYAGVKWNAEKSVLLTSGGRVFSITALGKNIDDARKKTLDALEHIQFEGMHYRRDIAGKAT